MTALKKLEANENKQRLITANPFCERCGKGIDYHTGQHSHRIAKSKANKKMLKRLYPGIAPELILNHAYNLPIACEKCNSYFNIGNNPGRVKRLVFLILNVTGLKQSEVTKYIEAEQ